MRAIFQALKHIIGVETGPEVEANPGLLIFLKDRLQISLLTSSEFKQNN